MKNNKHDCIIHKLCFDKRLSLENCLFHFFIYLFSLYTPYVCGKEVNIMPSQIRVIINTGRMTSA